MSIQITIGGTVIDFPSSAQSPNWAPGIIQFAQAVESALSTVVGPADIPAQTLNIDSYNPGTDVIIPNLSFSTTSVLSANIRYSVIRTTSMTTVAEAGNISIVYNSTNPVNSKWEIERDYVGNASISFTITDAGQVKFSTTTLSGSSHTGTISYAATALLAS